MTDIRRSAEALASEVGAQTRRLLGSLRKMAIDRTRSGLWKVLGYEVVAESHPAELFGGVGFHSRPASGSKAEAIVAFIGGAGAPVVIATRDEALRQAVGELEEDEAAIFNTLAIVRVMADGTVEIRSAGGTAAALATKADLDALRAALETAAIAPGAGGAAAVVAAMDTALGPLAPWPVGTTVLKGE